MNIKLMNGFVDLNPNSPNGQYHYKISKPDEITNGNWGCRIKLYKANGELIYYNSKAFAHCFNLNEDKFEIAVWPMDSNVMGFYEFIYGEVYDFVIIFLQKGFSYRIDLRINNNLKEFISFIRESNEAEILNRYNSFEKKELIKDIDKIKWLKKWY